VQCVCVCVRMLECVYACVCVCACLHVRYCVVQTVCVYVSVVLCVKGKRALSLLLLCVLCTAG